MAENIECNDCSQIDSAEHEGVCESVWVIQSDMERRRQPARLLVHDTYSCHKYGDDKRKTDKQWLL